MENLFMSAGCVVAIVLCFVGIIKTPFKSFKEKHPNWYKAVFTSITFVLALGLAVIDELYILSGNLWSTEFAILFCTVIAGVFGGYNGIYEGIGVKNLVKTIVEKSKQALAISKHEKAVKYLNKIEDIDEAITILTERKKQPQDEIIEDIK